MLNACPSNGPPFISVLCEPFQNGEASLIGNCVVTELDASSQDVFDDEAAIAEWSEEDIVFLHWRLLHRVFELSEPNTPLDEKIDILRWVFTEPELERAPFSFSNCVRVVTLSPLSPIPYCGVTDTEEIRDWLKRYATTWLRSTIDRYPPWVREAFLENPQWFIRRLEKNPQWINEQVKKHTHQGDLFA